jgi:2-amino-4-hydroxy-6-hydroxymethyldihydropteridine diphosphokinase
MLAFIGIGSNLENPLQQVMTATELLAQLPGTELGLVSSCYLSAPLQEFPVNEASPHQPDFVNRVVSVETLLSAEQLLDELQALEQRQGRVRLKRWEPRVIDLDILLYGDQIIRSERLTVPHPGLTERAFFLNPLAEIAPHLILPSGDSVMLLQQNCTNTARKL